MAHFEPTVGILPPFVIFIGWSKVIKMAILGLFLFHLFFGVYILTNVL